MLHINLHFDIKRTNKTAQILSPVLADYIFNLNS